MLDWLLHIDQNLFKFIHLNLANHLFDVVLPLLRNPYFWSPVYLFLLVYMTMHYKMKGIIWCLFFLLCFGFADFISASLIKPFIHRIRPCNDDALSFLIRDLVHCGSGFSFPSSHASNHFALSFFIIKTLGTNKPWVQSLTLLWAVSVCFAQIYVGVHYPLDILGGALLGAFIGTSTAAYFKMRFGLSQ